MTGKTPLTGLVTATLRFFPPFSCFQPPMFPTRLLLPNFAQLISSKDYSLASLNENGVLRQY